MSARRQSQSSSGSGFAALLILGLIAWLVAFIIRHIWVILGGLVVVGSIYLARAILRDNRRRQDAYDRYCAEVAARADQQDDWVAAGDDRGVYGPKAVGLMTYIRSGGSTVPPRQDAATTVSVPEPVSLSRQVAAPAVMAGGVGVALLLAQIGGVDTDPTPTPASPTHTTSPSPTWTLMPTTMTTVPAPTSMPTPTPIWTSQAPVTSIPPTAIYTAPPTTAAPPPTSQVPFSGGTYYRNCSAAHADGRYNIPRGDASYRPGLDRDGDGYACE